MKKYETPELKVELFEGNDVVLNSGDPFATGQEVSGGNPPPVNDPFSM